MGEIMAKKFQFDDDEDMPQEGYQEPSHIDELEDMKETETDQDEYTYTSHFDHYEEEDEQPMKKKGKKKFVWKWWHYLLIVLGVLFILFMVYIFILSNNDGPVYGKRCEGIVEISKDLKDAAIDTSQKNHSEIEKLDIEIVCKQIKVDIQFKAGMKAADAQKIAEDVVLTLDKLVGKPIENGKKYSTLLGKIDNVSQYEVNLYLKSADSEDFPIYGTKHVQKDEFSYTLASIRDKDSYDKARETLDKKDK